MIRSPSFRSSTPEAVSMAGDAGCPRTGGDDGRARRRTGAPGRGGGTYGRHAIAVETQPPAGGLAALRQIRRYMAAVPASSAPGRHPRASTRRRVAQSREPISSRRRADVRTAQRRASQLGEVSLSVEAPSPRKSSRRSTRSSPSRPQGGRCGPERRWPCRIACVLLPSVCALAAAQGTFRLAFLRIDGRPVAVQLAAERDGRYSLSRSVTTRRSHGARRATC